MRFAEEEALTCWAAVGPAATAALAPKPPVLLFAGFLAFFDLPATLAKLASATPNSISATTATIMDCRIAHGELGS